MFRRRFLKLTTCTAGLAGLSGCLYPSESEEDLFMSEWTAFLSIWGDGIDPKFSGVLRVVPSCRDEPVDIQITNGEPQDSIPYSREELGEECSFDLYIDDEQVESLTISGTERCSIGVDDGGSIVPSCEITWGMRPVFSAMLRISPKPNRTLVGQ